MAGLLRRAAQVLSRQEGVPVKAGSICGERTESLSVVEDTTMKGGETE